MTYPKPTRISQLFATPKWKGQSLINTININLALLIILAFCSINPTNAADQTVHNQFKDWVKRCADSGDFKDRCYVSQQLTLKESGTPLFNIAIGYPLDQQFPLVLVTTPLGIYLPAGLRIQVDEQNAARIVFAYCNNDGCHGYHRMTAVQVKEFKEGRWLNVEFLDGTRRAHQFDVSLLGFTASLESLSKN
jgi:invasion protein IalB